MVSPLRLSRGFLLGAAPMQLFRLVHGSGEKIFLRSPDSPSVFCFRELSGAMLIWVASLSVFVFVSSAVLHCFVLRGFSWTCGFGDFQHRLFLHPSHFWGTVFFSGATTFCFVLLVFLQAGFAVIRVGEASNPGPDSATDGVTTPLPVSQELDLMDILAVAFSPPQFFFCSCCSVLFSSLFSPFSLLL